MINTNIKKTKWISQGILKSIKYRDKLYNELKLTCPQSQEYMITKTNLRKYYIILRKSIRNAKKLNHALKTYK